MKIGFKNFKKFKEFPMIELAPVTLLVGPNNSGKSSFIKALTFLFANLAHQEKKNVLYPPFMDKISFHHNSASNFDWGDFATTLHKGDGNEISFTWEMRDVVFSFSFGATKDDIKRDPTLLTTLPVKSLTVESEKDGITIENIYQDGAWETSAKVNTNNFIKWLENSIEWLSGRANARSGISDNTINSTIVRNLEFWDRNSNHHFNERIEAQLYDYVETLASLDGRKDQNIEFSFVDKCSDVAQRALRDYCNYCVYLIAGHGNDSPLVAQCFEYIETHNAPHCISIPANDKNSFLSRTVAEFNSTVSREKRLDLYVWINNWMKKFNIGGFFEINTHFGGEILTVGIGRESEGINYVFGANTLMPLGTLGTGAIQIFVLLLKIATVWSKLGEDEAVTIIIEEPEQNLHPALQSQLADLFKDVYEMTHGRVQFVIETHSEYLIRRTQVIVAERRFVNEEALESQNPFKVYYFPEEGLPYKMIYQISGRFDNRFGDGFFDESSMQSILIARIERDIRNGHR